MVGQHVSEPERRWKKRRGWWEQRVRSSSGWSAVSWCYPGRRLDPCLHRPIGAHCSTVGNPEASADIRRSAGPPQLWKLNLFWLPSFDMTKIDPSTPSPRGSTPLFLDLYTRRQFSPVGCPALAQSWHTSHPFGRQQWLHEVPCERKGSLESAVEPEPLTSHSLDHHDCSS